jgi:hypothetical protein
MAAPADCGGAVNLSVLLAFKNKAGVEFSQKLKGGHAGHIKLMTNIGDFDFARLCGKR